MKKSVAVLFVFVVGCGSSATSEPSSSTSSAWHSWGGSSGGSSGSSGGASGGVVVACGNGGDPAATCASPEHCCFTNYSAQHDGYCTSLDCFFGTIDCDGPEDCASGDVCCMRAIVDPVDGTVGYTGACEAAGSCSATPLVHELCHVGGEACATAGETCVTARGNDPDLPGDLSICQ